MTNTLPSKNGSKKRIVRSGSQSAVGLQKHKRTPTSVGLALITPLLGQEFLDKYGLRDPLNHGLRYGVKTAFSALGASTRQFNRVSNLGKPATRRFEVMALASQAVERSAGAPEALAAFTRWADPQWTGGTVSRR